MCVEGGLEGCVYMGGGGGGGEVGRLCVCGRG